MPVTPASALTLADIDSARALRHIRALDLTEEWIPDVLRHEDQLADAAAVLSSAALRVHNQDFGASTDVEIPKTPFFSRSGQVLSLEDRIALHSVVALFAADIESRLESAVYSARLATRGRYFTRKGLDQWGRWLKFVHRRLRRHPWMIKTDVTAYFDTVRHEVLLGDLQLLGVPNDVRGCLASMLSRWSPLFGDGLLQGPDACRILGNVYLMPVDATMLRAGVQYSRYMDDIRILGRTKAEAIAGFRLLEREVRRRGLILSPSKTQLLHDKEARDADRDLLRTAATYLMDTGNYRHARRVLHQLFDESMLEDGHLNARSARFSLWRLVRIKDDQILARVLEHLDDLAPVAGVVAEYVRPHIAEPKVASALSDYLADAERVGHDYLLFYLFALMLEYPTALPGDWVLAASERMRDATAPGWLRGCAANVAARGRKFSDVAWIRQEARSSTDDFYVRFLLVALARSESLDPATGRHCSARNAFLARTVRYLQHATDLPSLVTLRARVTI